MSGLYQEASRIFWEQIGKGIEMVLATAAGDTVTARTVSVAAYEGKLYFVTLNNSRKYEQIMKNKKAALCVNANQITGTAVVLGHPEGKDNLAISDAIGMAYPEWRAQYAQVPDMALVEITPAHATFFLLENREGYIIDFEKDSAVQMGNEQTKWI